MSVFGLDDTSVATKKPEVKKIEAKKQDKPAGSQSDEAKEMLAKMKAKNDAGDCAFC